MSEETPTRTGRPIGKLPTFSHAEMNFPNHPNRESNPESSNPVSGPPAPVHSLTDRIRRRMAAPLRLPNAPHNGIAEENNESILSDAQDPMTGYSDGTRKRASGDPIATAKAVVGLVGIGIVVVGYVIKKRGRKLRRPDKGLIERFSEPVGNIIARHFPVAFFNDDIADITDAGVVVGEYLSEGPVTEPLITEVQQIGMETEPTEEINPLNIADGEQPKVSYLS